MIKILSSPPPPTPAFNKNHLFIGEQYYKIFSYLLKVNMGSRFLGQITKTYSYFPLTRTTQVM